MQFQSKSLVPQRKRILCSAAGNKCAVRATRAEHSRRFLRVNYAIEWVTTHLQEIPQRIR